jgi:acyl-CoA reductase-like NAD-dependent aldehyde dehydrogenase
MRTSSFGRFVPKAVVSRCNNESERKAELFDHLVGASQQRQRHAEVGFVCINEVSKHFLGAPFGGYKQSGSDARKGSRNC